MTSVSARERCAADGAQRVRLAEDHGGAAGACHLVAAWLQHHKLALISDLEADPAMWCACTGDQGRNA